MSVRHALLAIVATEAVSTYALRKEFEARTGVIWPLNIGQVSTTMSRLERDGLVYRAANEDAAPWQLTSAGKYELHQWWNTPLLREAPDRNELVIKLSMAACDPQVDFLAVIQKQRSAAMHALHDVTRAARNLAPDDLASRLILRHQIYSLEAEIRWLDDTEQLQSLHPRSIRPTAKDVASPRLPQGIQR
ncbi:MAG: PadR family transcriptional regulator [Propionibacteriaceae bacterium]